MIQLFALVITVIALSGAEHSCNDEATADHYATKTGYHMRDNITPSTVKMEGCSLVKVLWVIRHGTRNPGHGDIKDMNTRGKYIQEQIVKHFDLGSSNLCKETVEGIKQWNFTLTDDQASILTASGAAELEQMGKRIKIMFPDLLSRYDEDKIKILPTYKERTISSAKAFAKGAFGECANVKVPEPKNSDPVLRPYDFCPKYEKYEDDPNTYKEQALFTEGPEMREVVDKLEELLFNRTMQLTTKDAILMYDICRFETAWNPGKKVEWCRIFTEDDLKVIEYSEDLEKWADNGYKNELNAMLGVPLIKNITNVFEQDLEDATFYFSHSELLIPVLTMLGLYKDPFPLTHDIYGSPKANNRLFQTSKIGTFANNIGFALFNCTQDEQMRIKIFHQEIPVALPHCSSSDYCTWNEFKSAYQEFIEENFDEVCETSQGC